MKIVIEKKTKKLRLRLPGVEPGSIAWKAIILTVGLQTLVENYVELSTYNICLFNLSLSRYPI
jgi:hypothetical protein